MISKDDILKIAKLSKLKLSDEDVERYTTDLQSILKYVDKLNELNLDDVEPMSHAVDVFNVFRADEPMKSDMGEKVLDQAPERDGPYFKVPRVI